MNRIEPGEHRIETPVGTVSAVLHANGEVTVNNVASYRLAANVAVEVPALRQGARGRGLGRKLVFPGPRPQHELSLQNIEVSPISPGRSARRSASRESRARRQQEIDHIELFGPSHLPSVDSKNFVLCPGKAYDRSPCGTGTSAKLACLYADGKIREGQVWKQESIVGSVFEGTVRCEMAKYIPASKALHS